MKDDLYLIAFYTAKPRDPRKTKIKGYMTDPANIVYDERVEFSIGLKSKDQLSGKVILNLTRKNIVRNSLNPEAGFDEVVKYYCEAYPEYMEKVGFTLEEVKDESTDVPAVPTEEEKTS